MCRGWALKSPASGDCLSSPSATCHGMKNLLPPLWLPVNENSEALNQNKSFLLEVVYNTSFAAAMWKRTNTREKEMTLSTWLPAWTKPACSRNNLNYVMSTHGWPLSDLGPYILVSQEQPTTESMARDQPIRETAVKDERRIRINKGWS